jgi:hypothetical protein
LSTLHTLEFQLDGKGLRQLMPVFLCDRVAGEKTPYPSWVSHLPSDDKPGDAVGQGNVTMPVTAPTP